MSTQKIYAAVIKVSEKRLSSLPVAGGKHLDIGAGRGELIQELRHAIPLISSAWA